MISRTLFSVALSLAAGSVSAFVAPSVASNNAVALQVRSFLQHWFDAHLVSTSISVASVLGHLSQFISHILPCSAQCHRCVACILVRRWQQNQRYHFLNLMDLPSALAYCVPDGMMNMFLVWWRVSRWDTGRERQRQVITHVQYVPSKLFPEHNVYCNINII